MNQATSREEEVGDRRKGEGKCRNTREMQYITDCDKQYHVSEEKAKKASKMPVKVEKMHLLDTLFILSSK